MKVHPSQLAYSRKNGAQTCDYCGIREQWNAKAQPTVQGEALHRSIHLAHMVSAHLDIVNHSFTAAGAAEEVSA